MEAEHDLMTVAEVATGLRVSKMTVTRLIHKNELSAVRVGRMYRVKRSSYLELLNAPVEVNG